MDKEKRNENKNVRIQSESRAIVKHHAWSCLVMPSNLLRLHSPRDGAYTQFANGFPPWQLPACPLRQLEPRLRHHLVTKML